MFKRESTNGFTLIEILVVMTILSLISSIVLTQTQEARERSRDAVRQSDLNNLRVSMSVFWDRNDRYPANYNELINADLINTIPTDPNQNKKYPFATSTADFDLCLAACMELPENGGGQDGMCDDSPPTSVSYSNNSNYINSCDEDKEYYIGI